MSSESPIYFLTAASGKIGQRLVPLLLSQEPNTTLLLPTTNKSRLQSQVERLPEYSDSRIHVVDGDIHDPLFVETVLKQYSATAAFLCLTGHDELVVTLNLFDAIRRAETVKHVVLLSAAGNFGVDTIPQGALRPIAAGHVLVKYLLEAKLKYGLPREPGEPGGFTWTVIGPTLFFDNDLRSKESLLKKHLFDEPLGSKGVSRVDPADIALGVAHALQDKGKIWGGKKIMIGSLERYTNADVAKLWSDTLGQEISYLKSDISQLEQFEKDFRAKAGPVWARDMALMYEIFETVGFGITETEYKDQLALLGKAPSSYAEFVRKTRGRMEGRGLNEQRKVIRKLYTEYIAFFVVNCMT